MIGLARKLLIARRSPLSRQRRTIRSRPGHLGWRARRISVMHLGLFAASACLALALLFAEIGIPGNAWR